MWGRARLGLIRHTHSQERDPEGPLESLSFEIPELFGDKPQGFQILSIAICSQVPWRLLHVHSKLSWNPQALLCSSLVWEMAWAMVWHQWTQIQGSYYVPVFLPGPSKGDSSLSISPGAFYLQSLKGHSALGQSMELFTRVDQGGSGGQFGMNSHWEFWWGMVAKSEVRLLSSIFVSVAY